MRPTHLITASVSAAFTLALVVACGALPVVGADDDSPDAGTDTASLIVEAECDKELVIDDHRPDPWLERRYYAEIARPEGGASPRRSQADGIARAATGCFAA